MIYIIVVLSVLLVFLSAIIVMITRRNEELRADVERVTDEWRHLNGKHEDLQEVCEEQMGEIIAYRNAQKDAHLELAKAWADRDDAHGLLEKELIKTFSSVAPDRIMTEIGREGVYYEFKWDPPEQAEVHSIVRESEAT